jgi:hypothetical protein
MATTVAWELPTMLPTIAMSSRRPQRPLAAQDKKEEEDEEQDEEQDEADEEQAEEQDEQDEEQEGQEEEVGTFAVA